MSQALNPEPRTLIPEPSTSPTTAVREGRPALLADIETADDVEVTLRIDPLEVIQQASTATDQHQKTSPAGIVPLMALHMAGQTVDPRRQNGDLDLRGARIAVAPPILPDQSRFSLFGNSHLYRDCSTLVGSGRFPRKRAPPTVLSTTSAYEMYRQNYLVPQCSKLPE
jgi:hypothetical protein